MRAPAAVHVVRLMPEDWAAHRALRLEALADSPLAFGATYADNAAYDEQTWRARLDAVTYWQAREAGSPGSGPGEALGMVGLWEVPDVELPDEVTQRLGGGRAAYLIAMYVSPRGRGREVGDALVRTLLAEARGRGLAAVVLDVTDVNRYAVALYERSGFVFTGRGFAHPREDGLWEREMVCPLTEGTPSAGRERVGS